MGDKTNIEWTDSTWNPVRGCSRVSEGCRHCYAEGVAARFSGPGQAYEGLADRNKHGSKWTGKVVLVEDALLQPLRWKRPRRIFVNSMSDLFHENLPDEAIDRVFAVMALSSQHTFQILTKRPERMRRYFDGCDSMKDICDFSRPWGYVTHWHRRTGVATAMESIGKAGFASRLGKVNKLPLPNVWLGVSVEDQKAAEERIPLLLQTPAAKRFLSCEPLLGPVDLHMIERATGYRVSALTGGTFDDADALAPADRDRLLELAAAGGFNGTIDWVIAGGESGSGARPMHPDWARKLRDQCATAGVPFFFKQWGEYLPDDPAPDAHTAMRRVGKKAAGALLDGREHREFPS